MSYLYSSSAGSATNPAGAGVGGGGSVYSHSPYAHGQQVPPSAQGVTTAPSPYMHAGQLQSTTPNIPYPGTTQSSLMPGGPTSAYPGQAHQPSPMVGQMYLPSGGQLTVGSAGMNPSAMSAPATPAQPAQPFSGNVQPGAVTYTTTTDALGRVTYHHFRAQAATYRSPQGVTYTGIQWVPTETSSVPPVGIPQAGPDVLASFRGQLPIAPGQVQTAPTTPAVPHPGLGSDYRDDTRDWEKEERRRRREEKKRNAAWEAERLARERAEDKEMRRTRERDTEYERASRMRRPSFGAGLGADLNAGPYERERSRVRGDPVRERELREREEREMERRMGELDVSSGGRDGYYGEYGAGGGAGVGAPGTRSRRQSVSARAAPGAGIYDDSAYDRDSDDYGGYRRRDPSRHRSSIYAAPEQSLDAYGSSDRGRPTSIYGAPHNRSRPSSMYAAERSPYRRDVAPLQPSIGPDGVEVYPQDHVLAGQPIQGSGFGPSRSRNPSPNLRAAPYPGGLPATSPRVGTMGSAISPRVGGGLIPGVSPRMGGNVPLTGVGHGHGLGGGVGGGMGMGMGIGGGGYGASQQSQPDQLLPAPESFNRPINRAQTFTPFKDIRVQDLDELLDDVFHPLPPVLSTHDVLPEDWGRLMHDLTLAWKGHLPLPADKPTKRSDLIIDLLDLWNSMFFYPRYVELILYKGRNCRSGTGIGLAETRLAPEQLFAPGELGDEEEEESEEESEGEYSADAYDRYGGGGGGMGRGSHGYGQGNYGQGSQGRRHGRNQSQRREIARAARKKQKIEEKVQREMEANKRYTLWLKYVEPREREY